jgi:type VI secretion system secreted protein Hcp
MSATGQRQGQFSTTPIVITGLSHEIVSPRDPASGLPTGKRQHKPLTITKEIDRSTPLFLNALVTNENLPTVKISITDGTSNTIMTIELTNASVADRSEEGATEHISFTYQITARDDWQAPIA